MKTPGTMTRRLALVGGGYRHMWYVWSGSDWLGGPTMGFESKLAAQAWWDRREAKR